MLAVVAVLALWAGGVIPGNSGAGPVASSTTTSSVTDSSVSTTEPSQTTSSTVASGTSAPVISGGQVAFSGKGDFAGLLEAIGGNLDHENFGKLAGAAKVTAQLDSKASKIDLLFPRLGTMDNELSIGIAPESADLSAVGTGTYAGYPGIDIGFKGAITYWTLEGDLTIGADGGLPGGQPIIYHFLGGRSDVPPQVIPAFLGQFLDAFSSAMQTKDQTYLFTHLHPAVIRLYGEEKSRNSIAAQAPDSSYRVHALGASGPAAWDYNPPAGTVAVEDVYTVTAEVTSLGKTAAQLMHFGWVDGELYWFANLGPL